MGATSVTGKGHGDSHGLAKPENNTGCCGAKPSEETPIEQEKQSCYTKLRISSKASYKVGSNTRIKVCR